MSNNARELPENFHTLITPTGFDEAVNRLLQIGTIPVRRRRVYRVVYNNRYLWLNGNKTTFNTRPSARDAVASWVYQVLYDAAARVDDSNSPFNPRYLRSNALDRRLERLVAPSQTDTIHFVHEYVRGLFDSGVLRLEETELPQMTATET